MLLRFPLIVFVILILPDNVKGAGNDVCVQIGEDLIFNVTENDILKKFHTFYWKFNSKDILVVFDSSGEPTVKNYTGRIELFGDEGCVKLKNLQKSDSGVYSAVGAGDKQVLLEEYNVTVKDQNTATTVASSTAAPATVSPAAIGIAVSVALAIIVAIGLLQQPNSN